MLSSAEQPHHCSMLGSSYHIGMVWTAAEPSITGNIFSPGGSFSGCWVASSRWACLLNREMITREDIRVPDFQEQA